MIDEVTVNCPYCGEAFTALVDFSAGGQEYIEDCFVCCQPIVFNIVVDADGNLTEIITRQDNE